MPWTFAHPAAVLALRRVGPVRLPLAALIIGSVAPDLGYYLGWFGVATFAHTLWGAIAVCVPFGLVLVACFSLLRRRLCYLLPQPHRGALSAVPSALEFRSPASTALIVFALILGALTHIAWDGFTHPSGWFVVRLPVLVTPLRLGFASYIPLYKVLQHASSLIGVATLGVAYTSWLRRQAAGTLPVDQRLERRKLMLILVLLFTAIAAAAGWALIPGSAAHDNRSSEALVFHGLLVATTLFSILIVAVAIVIPQETEAR